MPPFDPNMGVAFTDPTFSAANFPNYIQQLQSRMALFRSPFLLTQPPATAQPHLQQQAAAAVIQQQPQQPMNSLQAVTVMSNGSEIIGPANAAQQATTATGTSAASAPSITSRPPSVASSLNNNTMPPTPTSLLSPTSLMPGTIAAASYIAATPMTTVVMAPAPTLEQVPTTTVTAPFATIAPLPVFTQFTPVFHPSTIPYIAIDEIKIRESIRTQM